MEGGQLDLLQAVFLALIQGITEFLPISSSGHLVLPSILLGWPDQGLAFDTSVHLGSLTAVVIYFRSDIRSFARAGYEHLVKRRPSSESRFAGHLLIASLPIIPVGYYSRFLIEANLRSIEVITAATIFFALALWLADRFRRDTDTELTAGKALFIGIAQCLALIPGTSRSGVTITMALLLGHSRHQAARISFLIAIPAIAGAGTLKLWDLSQMSFAPDWTALATGVIVSAIAAYSCITLFLGFIERIGMLPFVIYRLLLGAVLLAIIL
jgi:undecaprenyl-diphosphatase